MSKVIMVQDVIDEKITVAEAMQMGIMHQGEMFSYFDEGCSRYVFVNEDKTKVIKIEQSKYGNFNEQEYNVYKNASEAQKEMMADTKLTNGLIEQEFVLPIKFGGRKLTMEQIRFAASCRNEVGWKGDKLVCFDLDEFKKY